MTCTNFSILSESYGNSKHNPRHVKLGRSFHLEPSYPGHRRIHLQEPGLTTANMFMATVLAPPFAWQWNRNTKTFVTVPGTTDYTVAMSDFGWLEKAQINNATLNPTDYELTIYPLLSSSGSQARPDKITVFSDDNAGNYIFRLMSVPDLVYTVTLTYQKAPIQATAMAGASLGSITSIAAASAGAAPSIPLQADLRAEPRTDWLAST